MHFFHSFHSPQHPINQLRLHIFIPISASHLFSHLFPSFEGTYAYVSFCIPCITASIYQQCAASSKSTFHPLIEPLCIHSALPLSKLRTTIRMLHVSLFLPCYSVVILTTTSEKLKLKSRNFFCEDNILTPIHCTLQIKKIDS